MGFASCHRFSGEFRLNTQKLEIVMDCENLEISPDGKLDLEEFFIDHGDREALLENFGRQIHKNHQRLPYPANPTVWCSWYCYGPDVTEKDIFANLAAHLFASGGMILSSDIIMDLEDKQKNIIRKMLKVNGQAAKFDDRTFKV